MGAWIETDNLPPILGDESENDLDTHIQLAHAKGEINLLHQEIISLKEKILKQAGCIEWQKDFISELITEKTELEKKVPNETKKILCFGNAPFADDRDSEDNLCNLIAKETGAEVVNLSIPDSYLSMKGPGINVTYADDYYTFYWLMCFAALDNERLPIRYNNLARGKDEWKDYVVDYLLDLDLNTVDTIVLMYDASDYLIGRMKETPDNLSNPLTFCGNMNAGIELLKSTYPHLQIIVMSPTYAYALDENGNYISSDIVKVEGESLSSYAITQLNLCQVSETTFIDHIYGTVHADNADEYLTDNLHLNVEGRKAVASRFAEIYKRTWDRYEQKLKLQQK